MSLLCSVAINPKIGKNIVLTRTEKKTEQPLDLNHRFAHLGAGRDLTRGTWSSPWCHICWYNMDNPTQEALMGSYLFFPVKFHNLTE